MERFFRKFLLTALVAVGAFSGEADALCAGTVRFKPPVDWTEAYFGIRNCSPAEAGHVAAKDADGYFTFDLSNIGHQESGATYFSILSSVTQGSISIISRTAWETSVVAGEPPQIALTNNAVFACPGAGNTVYIAQDPLNATPRTYVGTAPPSAKYLYVLIPDDKEWQSDNMMVSANGGVGVQMTTAPGMCGWMMMVYEDTPDEVLVYLKNKPEEKLGVTGLWGNEADPTPIPLKSILEAFGSDRLYFIPDDTQWPEGMEDAQGLFVTDPGVSGVCSFNLAALIYDTDEDLWKAMGLPHVFSTGEWRNADNSGLAGNCIGVFKGIVQETLGPDKKPQLSTTGNGPLCFQDEATFSKLFNYTAGVNEVVCRDILFQREGDGRWGYNSDNAVTDGYRGGFYPVENTTSVDVISINGQKLGPTTGANKKRLAEGPVQIKYGVYFDYTGDFDKYCQSPGWMGEGSVDCGGLYANGYPYFSDGEHPDVWNWDAYTGGIGNTPRWDYSAGVLRNQQYCFESHARFRYSSDQEFSFRGTDDIWVFIAGKLAVDNGGTHLPAPGYVQLKNLKDAEGNALVEGQEYDLDIFFCDRRTTMTSVIIKTNIFIKQTSGLNTSGKENADGSVNYSVCYEKSGDGSCAAVAAFDLGGNGGAIHACDDAIKQYGTLKYKITTRTGQEIAALESGKLGFQYGGIDISNPFKPIVNTDKISGLAPGSYRLVIDFYDLNGNLDVRARTYIHFRIKGNLDVMTQTSVYTANAGDEKSPYYAVGTKWRFVGEGLAGVRVPVYVSAFAGGGVDLLSAVGQDYSLNLAAGIVAYTSQTGNAQVTWPKAVNETGIDTIWVTAPLDALVASPTEFGISLKSTARINFYASSEEVPSSSSEKVKSSSSQGSLVTSSASTQSSSSVKRSSSSVRRSSSSKKAQGGECTLTDKGNGKVIQKCGDQETVLYKALCGNDPYDPEGDYFCYGVNLYEKCDGDVYDIDSQKCVDDVVVSTQAIKTVPQVSWSVQTKGRTIHVLGATVGNNYVLLDMQGRVLKSGIVNDKNFAIPVGLGGQYMLKFGNQSQVVRVW